MSFQEVVKIQGELKLTLDAVDSFHGEIQKLLIRTTGVSSEYVSDYVRSFTWIKNYKACFILHFLTNDDIIATVAPPPLPAYAELLHLFIGGRY